MESDLQQHPTMFLDHQNHHHQPQMNSGLTRFKSAPSSYFSNIIDKEFYEHLFNRPSSPETERVFARFMNSLSGSGSGGGGGDAESASVAVAVAAGDDDSLTQDLLTVQQQLPIVKEEIEQQSQTLTSMNNETLDLQQLQRQPSNMNNYGSSGPQKSYQSSGRPPLPNQMKTGRGSCSNLIRHGSSPAGLFSNINIETGFAVMRGIGTIGAANSTSIEANFSSSAARLKNASAPNYSAVLGGEIGNCSNPQNNLESEGFAETRGNDFIPGFPLVSTWEDTAMISDNITGLKRYRDDDDVKPFSTGLNAAENKNETGGQTPATPLAHQTSMPNTTAELAAIEKFLQLSDSVPCKIRAKRGCATHPRSIAERVRRTKISERMRKLQDLVPNMDKQTNTSDMLDLAVEYIKDLQKQVETLSQNRAKCTCSHHQ
ncbi:unnamed protein product [Lathyrus oleraceus]|uniref:BHLH domain-containing protein n=1 Tax=Pisum sativum TaxID=3888 RepID=A0A9D4VW17_PEA|nr:transcription factor bHLH122-like isoform X2 [Pisum sativum]KAI5390582.1 hypothetical protein KIW84_075767 [Pisum sativum]